MNSKTFVVVSDDKITAELFKDFNHANVILIKDQSSSISRVIKLILKKRIPLKAVFFMVFAELMRRKSCTNTKFEVIKSNIELLNLYRLHKPEKIVLFRAGLIIKRKLFPSTLKIYNIHCASLPEYGGLASIYKARLAGDLNQKATLHVLIDTIDGGEVLHELPYKLSPKESYRRCEDVAYKTGFELLCKTL